jgi:hypothetical protein
MSENSLTQRMLAKALANNAIGPTVIVGANHAEAMRLASEFAALAGSDAKRPMPDTVDVLGRRVYFFALHEARDKARGMWPGPRYIDHHAADLLVRSYLSEIGHGEPQPIEDARDE